MILDFDIYKFLERMLPVHKRQENRLKLFWWPLKQLQTEWDNYKEWRKDAFFRANITGQLMSLEAYLNKYVEGANGGISIIEEDDQGVWCGLEIEETDEMELGLEDTEPDDYIELAINGEEGTSLPVNFRVIAPGTANIQQINEYVNQYKIAGKSFDIINN
jgi:hypothetical protein